MPTNVMPQELPPQSEKMMTRNQAHPPMKSNRRLQESSRAVVPPFRQLSNAASLLEFRTSENARLHKEIACHQAKDAAARTLLEDLCLLQERLQCALAAFQDALTFAESAREPNL